MLQFIPRVALLAASLFILLTSAGLLPPTTPPLIVAYTGMCGAVLGGTCLRDAHSGHVVHWADYGNFVDDWSPDMQRNVYSDPRDYSIRSFHQPDGAINQLTTSFNATQGFAPRLSRDGRMVAYASATAGRAGLRVHVMEITTYDELVNINLENNLRFAGAFYWSPDGTRLAVFTRESSGGANFAPILWLVDVATGQVNTIGVTATPYAAWSPDSTRLAYINATETAITVLNVGTGTIEREYPTRSGALSIVSTPIYAPDGASILFINADTVQRETIIQTLDTASGTVTELTRFRGDLRFEGLQWLENGVYVVEDRLPSSYTDDAVIYHIDPATRITRELDRFMADDYVQVVEW
jgi:Tol biopolymer transport system component